MKFFFLFWLSLSLWVPQVHAQESLRIGVIASLYPVIENSKPRLTQQIKMPVTITALPNEQIYSELHQKKSSYDVVIFGENDRLGSVSLNRFIEDNTQVIASSQVVLWCPNIFLPKRISLNRSIEEAQVQSIAMPGINSVIGDLFLRSMPELPGSIHLLPTSNSLTALQMAHSGQAQCAVTIDKWLKPTDQYSVVSSQPVNFRGFVSENSRYTAQAKNIISIIGSPLLQPLMVRSSLITPPPIPVKIITPKRKKAVT